MIRGMIITVVWLAALAVSGCAVDDEIGRRTNNIVAPNGMTVNGMTANGMTANGMTVNSLGLLSGDSLDFDEDSNEIDDTDEGRNTLAYVVRCALPAHQVLIVDHGDTVYEFAGGIGLTPHWAHGPLGQAGERWITACLMAHVNAFGVEVPLSIRGPSGALATTGWERQGYPVQEGAFFGNVFAEQPFMAACVGDHDPGDSEYLPDRVCATSVDGTTGLTNCNFSFAGPCASACSYTSNQDHAHYGCRADTGSSRVSEVVTVFLAVERP